MTKLIFYVKLKVRKFMVYSLWFVVISFGIALFSATALLADN